MITLRRPTDETLLATLDASSNAELTHPAVGSLRRRRPTGFVRDQARVLLGRGPGVFRAAREAIGAWKMMPPSMVSLVARDPTLKEDMVVGVLLRALGLWSFNPCRVVYLIDDEQHEVRRYGFAYATLPGHIECGEEHFVCEWHPATDEVWYALKADSRPHHPLAWLGYPYARWLQRRFRKQSCRAMIDAVQAVPRDPLSTTN